MTAACDNPVLVESICKELERAIEYIRRHPESFTGRYPTEPGPTISVHLEPCSDSPLPGYLTKIDVKRTDLVVLY